MERHRQQATDRTSGLAPQLQDGFQELFTFRGHRLQQRGFNTVESLDDSRRVSMFSSVQNYVSWDAKQVLLWSHNSSDPASRPSIVNQVKFSNQPNYICAIVHVLKMKVFLAAALDMSFKIFDNHLQLLESIHHDERAILQMECDSQKELVFTSGASGIAAWRIYRNLQADKAHIMEKMYVFAGCDTWITNMIYQPQYNRIYAVKENTVQVLSTTRRSVVTALENAHDAPVNVVCWYDRNQFYLTGCSRGEIKCWTMNFNKKKTSRAQSPHRGALSSSSSSAPREKNFALLHTFQGHTKGVTAIHLHPVSGLAISTSLDGFMRVLNLEALNELFSIYLGAGVLGMRVVPLSHGQSGCLVSLADATVKLWRISSVCDFFAVASSRIAALEAFENLEGEQERQHRLRLAQTQAAPQPKMLSVVEHLLQTVKPPNNDDDKTQKNDGVSRKNNNNKNASSNNDKKTNNESNQTNNANSNNNTNINNSTIPGFDASERLLVTYSSQDLRVFTHKGTLLGRLEPEHVVNGIKSFCTSVFQRLLFCLCENDKVRVFCMRRFAFPLVYEFSVKNPGLGSAPKPTEISALMAGTKAQRERALAQSMLAINNSTKNKNGKTNNNKNSLEGLAVPLHSLSSEESAAAFQQQKNTERDEEEETERESGAEQEAVGLCCALVDVAPANSMRAPRHAHKHAHRHANGSLSRSPSPSHLHETRTHAHNDNAESEEDHLPPKRDPRGEPVASHIECFLLLGLATGAIMFLDVLNRFEVVMSVQAINGVVLEMKYRRRQKELLVYGKDFSHTFACVKIYKLPDMECVGEIRDLRRISCFAHSFTLNFFALGTEEGAVRLFSNHFEDKTISEVVRMGENHDTRVVSVCFLDDLRVYASCAADGKVKFWDFEKRLVKTIQLNIPTCAIVSNGGPGDVLMAQNHYLLTIPRRVWDEDDALQKVKALHAEEDAELEKNESNHRNNDDDSDGEKNKHANAAGRGALKDKDNEEDDNSSSPSVHSTASAANLSHSLSAVNAHSNNARVTALISRRASKLSVNAAAETRKRLSMSMSRKSSRMMSMSSMRSEDSEMKNGSGRAAAAQVNLEEIERDIVLPTLRSKQFQFISAQGREKQINNAAAALSDDEQERDKEGEDNESVLHQYSQCKRRGEERDDTYVMPSDSVMRETLRQLGLSESPSLSLAEESSSISASHSHASDHAAQAQVLDVLHPRFLVHKKAPARMLQLEEIGAHVAKYVGQHSSTAGERETATRTFAQLGLSPRARMTLLNPATATAVATSVGATPSRPSAPPPSHTQHRNSTNGGRRSSVVSADDQLLVQRTQEQLILRMSVGMQVSGDYKQQRSALNEERQQRFSTLSKRSTMLVKRDASGDNDEAKEDEDAFNANSPRMRRTANVINAKDFTAFRRKEEAAGEEEDGNRSEGSSAKERERFSLRASSSSSHASLASEMSESSLVGINGHGKLL